MPIQEDRHFFTFKIISIEDKWTNDKQNDLSIRPF
ncbi:DUF3800 domain-containing protein [Staphylococcus argenteus]|nr:DUF3800 domain-containing protein [Staphylococcus argenteus]